MSLVHLLMARAAGGPIQHDRLLTLHTPLGADVLVAERLHVDEAIAPHAVPLPDVDTDDAPATGLRLVVHALSVDAHLALGQLVGQPALVELLTSHSRTALRPWHGHITHAALVGSDGGLARYRLVIEPWLSFLAHRQDSWVFQHRTVRQIVDEVFADYQAQGRLAPAWRWDLADDAVYPARSLCVQYQESDLQFVQRLLREEGLFHWFEHTGAAQDPALGAHTLVIADHNGAFTPNVQATLRYTHSGIALAEDSVTGWQRSARLHTAALRLASPDYRKLSLRETQQAGTGAALPELSLDDIPGAYAYEDSAQGERLALRQMQALDALRLQATAQATVRSLAPGRSFTLRDHPVHDGSDPLRDRFVALRLHHRARNNLSADARAAVAQAVDAPVRPADSARLANDSAEPLYSCQFVAQPVAVPVRCVPRDDQGQPDPRLHPRPSVHGVQTAVVVGLAAPVHTDRDHRIKLQFHWQRGGRGSHRLAAPADDNAPASEASGTWVRVAESVAGANWGSHFIPRLGQEVLVSFVEGDIDRPVVIGSIYNGGGTADAQGNRIGAGAASATGNANAWFPGEAAQGELQAHRHAAVLAGYKTQELASSQSGAGGHNQLVFDDTPGGNRIELSTTTARTRLQLGHLLNQHDNQRLQPRGHGVDLATAAWGAVRAGRGLLLSAHGRAGSQSAGHQIDSREAQAVLEQGGELMRGLAESAGKQNATLRADPVALSLPVVRAQVAGKESFAAAANCTAAAGTFAPSLATCVAVAASHGFGVSPEAPKPATKSAAVPEIGTGVIGKALLFDTQLGADVNDLAAKSPSLQHDIRTLVQKGWMMRYGEPGQGSHASRGTKVITIDGNEAGQPKAVVQSLAHEVGHATYPYEMDLSSKQAFVDGALADEGAATLNNVKIQREILSNGGPDIGIAGSARNHRAYNKAYDTYLQDGNATAARQAVGGIYGAEELTSTTKQPYAKYYGDWYDKQFSAGQ